MPTTPLTGTIEVVKKQENVIFPITTLTAVREEGSTRNLTNVLGDLLPKAGGTMSGELNMGNQKVSQVAAPTANTDAANKNYVDNATTNSSLYNKIFSPYAPHAETSYAIVAADAGKTLGFDNASEQTISITNSFPMHSEIAIVRIGTGNVKIAAAGEYLHLAGEAAAFTVAQIPERFGMCAIKKLADNWFLISGVVEKVS